MVLTKTKGRHSFQPVFTTTDKERTTTIKVDSTVLHTNAIVKRKNSSTSAKKGSFINVSSNFDWFCLLPTTAPVSQFKDILQQNWKRDLGIDEQEIAKTVICSLSNHNTLFSLILLNVSLPKKCLEIEYDLLPYSPFLNNNRICARTRLKHSPMQDANKNPIFLHAKTLLSAFNLWSKTHIINVCTAHRICTTVLARKLNNFGPQKNLETQSPPLFLVQPLSRKWYEPFHGRSTCTALRWHLNYPMPVRERWTWLHQPILLCWRYHRKKLHMSLQLFNKACNAPGSYQKSDKWKLLDSS